MVKQKKAFTLVELIVVITILAILGTIAFISLQGYSADARDSVRTSDLSRMRSSLELFQLDAGKYPQVTDENIVVYSGATAWTQGEFGESTFYNVDKLDKIPTDPVNGKKYTYSTTSTRQEYQIAGVMESDNLAINLNQVNAATKTATVKISGNYNGKLLKVLDGSITYVLAVPSIITADGFDVEEIATNNTFVYDGYRNLPASYSGSNYEVLGDTSVDFVDETYLLLFSGSTSTLSSSDTDGTTARLELINNMQSAYSGTALENVGEISEILALSTDEAKESMAGTVVNNNLGGSVASSSSSSEEEVEEIIYSSCQTRFVAEPSSEDGIYTIDPENDGVGFDVYCDMTTDGGGWTLVAYSKGGTGNPAIRTSTNGDINISDSTTQLDTTWKYSDTTINLIRTSSSVYRLTAFDLSLNQTDTNFISTNCIYNHLTSPIPAECTVVCNDLDLTNCHTVSTSATLGGIGGKNSGGTFPVIFTYHSTTGGWLSYLHGVANYSYSYVAGDKFWMWIK